MLKKTIKYTDFNGDAAEEDFFFHLTKAELIEIEMTHEGGMEQFLKNIIVAEDNAALIKEFKSIILLAYGKKSTDGRRFTKNQTLREEFESTEAYSELFMELITNTGSAIAFMNGIVPADMSASEALAAGIDPKVTPLMVVEDEDNPKPRIVTREDLVGMTGEEFARIGQEIVTGAAIIAE